MIRTATFVALALAVVPSAVAQSPDASVVRVLCTTPVRAVTGSGVVVGPRSVLTSQRVVACAGEGGRIGVGASPGAVVAAAVDWASPARDLALLTTAAALPRPVATLARAGTGDGADVRVVGFPGPGTLDATDRLRDAVFVPSILPGVVTRTARDNGALTHDTDAALTPGLRGALVANACGEMVGVVGEQGGDAGARLRILGREGVADVVQSRRLETPVAPAPCVAPGAAAPVSTDVPTQEAGDALPAWLWAVALGVLLAGLLPLLARGRRKASEDQSPANPSPSPLSSRTPSAPSALTSPATGWRLVGQVSALAGRSVAVAERVRIGRDPERCELVIPESAASVSKRHAVVWVDGGEVWIQDVSTNGTFVDGRRLPKNQPERLADGAVVSFATPETAMRLQRG